MTEIKGKQVGQNYIVTIDGTEKLSKKFENKEERDNVSTLVKDYIAKPTKKKLDVIKKLMTVNTAVVKDKAKITKKVAEKKEKSLKTKPVIKVSKEETKHLQAKVKELEEKNAKLEQEKKEKLVQKPLGNRRPEY